MLDSERFADKSPAQVWAILLDEGIYLASIRTMYRVLTLADQVRERRAQAQHPPRVRPELVAGGPDQVWTWDITKLKGPWRGLYFDLYVMLDIFSRKVIHWEIHPGEDGDLAKAFMQHAIIANDGTRPSYIHADNGTSMTSRTVSDLLTDLQITRSHSRPHVSNDNPYSESAFKTLKYCPVFPGSFATIEDARAFCRTFFTYYNTEHRHSGIGGLGPGWSGRGQVVTPDVADDLRVAIAGVHAWLPGDGAWRVEHLHPVGHPVVPARDVVVVHGHPEHLTRRGQRLAVKGLADPPGAVDRGVLGGVGEYGEDRLGWGVNDRGCADGFVGHGGASL